MGGRCFSIRVKISNPSLLREEKTYITLDYSSGTSLAVRNNNNAATNSFAIAGEPGQERTESKSITSTTGASTITLSGAYSFSHPKSTPVYIFLYDQISFERKPSGGSFAEISGSPFSIDWDNADNKTIITVPSGASTDTYRWRLKNSVTGAYSDYSDSLPGTGIARNKLGYILQQVKINPITRGIEDHVLIDYANDFQALVYEQMPKAWWFVKEGDLVSTVADEYRYSIDDNWSDFLSMKFMLFNYVSGDISDTYPISYVPLQEFYNMKADANQATDDRLKYWTLLPPDTNSSKGYLGFHPTPKTANCFLKPVYQFELTNLNSFNDTIVVPEPKGYIDYILMRIHDDIKSDATNAGKYEDRMARSLLGLKKRSRRQLGQAEMFRYRGHKGFSKQYGGMGYSWSPDTREQYF